MLVVLPLPEIRTIGGNHPVVDFFSLSFNSFNPVHEQITTNLVAPSASREAVMETLESGPRLADEVAISATLLESPIMPALGRYTRVFCGVLSPSDLPETSRARLTIGSALFGVVDGDSLIPHYRPSDAVKFPFADQPAGAAPTMKRRWDTVITEALNDVDFLIDLRSDAYANLGRAKTVTAITVLTVGGKVVNHFDKHYKGLSARAIVPSDTTPTSPTETVDTAYAAGYDASLDDDSLIFRVLKN